MILLKIIIFYLILLPSAYYDLKKMIIPDILTFTGILTGLLFVFLGEKEYYLFYLIGGLSGFTITYLTAVIGKHLLKKEILGGGDIKLITVIGLFTGYPGLLIIILMSSLIGIFIIIFIYKDTSRPIPYGFYLASSAIVVSPFLNILNLT
ncbi:MAG: A24 family peptidase [Spirochaetes bacterium]|nr:A24 family peptidase [Spirochaetota bacterium]